MPQAVREEDPDALGSLEERINRAVELVMSLRDENETLARQLQEVSAERDAARDQASKALDQAQRATQELDDLRTERKQVRTRIEKLLGQMDLLSNA